MDDPFFTVKEEVQKAITNVNGLFLRFTGLLDKNTSSTKEIDWLKNEIKTNTRSIEWDLEDLTETISIVESNPQKFNLTVSDIEDRQMFIKKSRELIEELKITLQNAEANTNINNTSQKVRRHSGNKYSRLCNDIQFSNQRFINDQQQQQETEMNQQDKQLENVSASVGMLKSMGGQIGKELDEQAIILDDLGHEIEQTDSRLNTILVRVEKMLRLADDKKQTYVLIALIIMMLIVFILFMAL